MRRLKELGLNDELEKTLNGEVAAGVAVGRVICEYKERYDVSDGVNIYNAEITGNMRFSATSRSDFPAAGDWVRMTVYEGNMAIINSLIPRRNALERQSVSRYGEIQIIAANVDCAFIMQAIDNNFNINRLERYLTICYNASIEPVILISKVDLASNEIINNVLSMIRSRQSAVKILTISNINLQGLDQVKSSMTKGKTYCLIGSSGVGKSTLINLLLDKDVLKTNTISLSTGKGKHTTSHRELFILDNGSIIIDTPGMRELGVTEEEKGIETAFEQISELGRKCKFPDCRHEDENGCAVLEAVNNGLIDNASLISYKRIRADQQRFQTTVAEKRRKDKEFGKMLKNYKKDIKKLKPGW